MTDALRGDAREAYDSATLLLHNGDYAGAPITKFQQAYDLSEGPAAPLRHGGLRERSLHAYAHMKRLLEALRTRGGPLECPPTNVRALGRHALGAVAKLVGALRLSVLPNGATVLLDGAPIGTAPLYDLVVVDLVASTRWASASPGSPRTTKRSTSPAATVVDLRRSP